MSKTRGLRSGYSLLKLLGALAICGSAGCRLLPAPRVATATQTYVVRPGDTPLGVALMFGTDVRTLVALNSDKHPEMGRSPMKFNAGWTILVPAGRNSPTVTTVGGSGGAQLVVTPLATTPAANGGHFDEAGAMAIVRLTNEARSAVGVAALSVDERLMAIARKRAIEIVSDWGHQGLADDCGECGENIVKGPGGPQSDFDWWMGSPSHRNNLLFPGYAAIGVARYVVGRRVYSVQIFHG